MSLEKLWKATAVASGIRKVYFNEYFKHKEVAYAFVIKAVKKYENPKCLSDYGLFTAPQSWIYLDK